MSRQGVLSAIADAVADRGPLRVAVDGPDAAGKTTFADELAAVVVARGRPLVRVSLDGFHRPRGERLARGALSAEGYLEDSFDLAALRRDVIEPLGPGGTRCIVRARYDWRADAAVEAAPEIVADDAVLLLDGVFLLRAELAGFWERSVFLFARPEVVLARALERDGVAMGGRDEVERRYRARYLPAQALYLARARPHERATVCVENSDPSAPTVGRGVVGLGVERWIAAWLP